MSEKKVSFDAFLLGMKENQENVTSGFVSMIKQMKKTIEEQAAEIEKLKAKEPEVNQKEPEG